MRFGKGLSLMAVMLLMIGIFFSGADFAQAQRTQFDIEIVEDVSGLLVTNKTPELRAVSYSNSNITATGVLEIKNTGSSDFESIRINHFIPPILTSVSSIPENPNELQVTATVAEVGQQVNTLKANEWVNVVGTEDFEANTSKEIYVDFTFGKGTNLSVYGIPFEIEANYK